MMDGSGDNVAYLHGQEERQPPHNLEMEQALLGAVMVNRDAMFQVLDAQFDPDYLYEPLHRRIFGVCAQIISDGYEAKPTTVYPYLKDDEALQSIGGKQYLARLTVAAVTTLHAREYAEHIHDLYIRRQLIEAAEDIVQDASQHDTERKIEKIIDDAETRLAQISGTAIADKTVWDLEESLSAALATHDRLQSGEGAKDRMPYGIAGLDEMLGGIPRGEYGVIAARPGMGKSMLAACIAVTNGLAGFGVGFQCPDMGHERVVARLVSVYLAITGKEQVSYRDILNGTLNGNGRAIVENAKAELAKLPIRLDDKGNPTVGHMAARFRGWRRQFARQGHSLDLGLVDHMHNVRASNAVRGRGKTEQVGEISNDLKGAARDLDIGLLAFAQIRRLDKNEAVKRPSLDDLRWAGEIEQDVRWAAFLHRPWYYEEEKVRPKEDAYKGHAYNSAAWADYNAAKAAKENLMEIIVAKQNNGPTGTVKAWCDLTTSYVTDWSEENERTGSLVGA